VARSTPAIAGVSSTVENRIEELFPSVAMTSLGRWMVRLYNCWPVPMGPLPLSAWLFVLPSAPLVAVTYVILKLWGPRYLVTNRAVKQLRGLGRQVLVETPWSQVARATVDPDSRLPYFRTGDVRVEGLQGETLQLLRAVPYPDRFASVLNTVATARQSVQDAQDRIHRRRL
jgi:hypothetical protein